MCLVRDHNVHTVYSYTSSFGTRSYIHLNMIPHPHLHTNITSTIDTKPLRCTVVRAQCSSLEGVMVIIIDVCSFL